MWILRFPGFFSCLSAYKHYSLLSIFLGVVGSNFLSTWVKFFGACGGLKKPLQYPITPPRSHCSSRRGEAQPVREHLDGKGACNAQKTRHGLFKMNWKLDPIQSESDRSGSQLLISSGGKGAKS